MRNTLEKTSAVKSVRVKSFPSIETQFFKICYGRRFNEAYYVSLARVGYTNLLDICRNKLPLRAIKYK